jgi:hypothetical protein
VGGGKRQGDLFDGGWLRDEGIARAPAKDRETSDWSGNAYVAIVPLAQQGPEIHTDDVAAIVALPCISTRGAMFGFGPFAPA